MLLHRLSLADVEKKVSELFGYRGRAVITDYACIGTDLDKAEEWAEAEKYLQFCPPHIIMRRMDKQILRFRI